MYSVNRSFVHGKIVLLLSAPPLSENKGLQNLFFKLKRNRGGEEFGTPNRRARLSTSLFTRQAGSRQIYIWTACSASKSVIKQGRSERVFAHKIVDLLTSMNRNIFVYFNSQRCSSTHAYSPCIRQSLGLAIDNASIKSKNIRAGSPMGWFG